MRASHIAIGALLGAFGVSAPVRRFLQLAPVDGPLAEVIGEYVGAAIAGAFIGYLVWRWRGRS